MKKVIRWEADDGSLHVRRADAARKDRDLRANRAGTYYGFLISADHVLASDKACLPAGTDFDPDLDDDAIGTAMYAYYSPAGLPLEKAIERAVRRCRALDSRFGCAPHGWLLDHEAHVIADGGNAGSVDLCKFPAYAESEVAC